MISEEVRKQLLSLEFAIPTSYDEKTNTYFIPKYTGAIYKKSSCYLVQLKQELSDEILLSWNNQKVPNSRYMKIAVDNVLGKLIHVTGLECDYERNIDLNTMWSGWLNIDFLIQLKLLQ